MAEEKEKEPRAPVVSEMAEQPESTEKSQKELEKSNSQDEPEEPRHGPHSVASSSSSTHSHSDDIDIEANRHDNTNIVRTKSAATVAANAELMCALTHTSSLGPDTPAQPWSSYVEIPDEFYDRVKPRRKVAIVALMSFCSLLAPISSTTVLPAVPNVAAEFGTTGSVINISNALFLFSMGLSPIVWSPLSEVYGRRNITIVTASLFFCCSLGTALAPNLAAYFVFRVMTAFEGTAFILVGSAAVGDIYRPSERATAMGWFLSGTLVGPALGPFLGGIIVTYRSWRVIFWLQSALAAFAFGGIVLLMPETIYTKKIDSLAGMSLRDKARVLAPMVNPTRVVRLFIYPNLIMTGAASSALLFNMYAVLTPIRYVLNPRFNLTTPMQSGLFYLAPGAGYVIGTFFGGRYADYMLKRWVVKRGGVRVPEDRLRSALPFFGVVIPACMLIYGWTIEYGVGGIPLAVIVLFLQGVAQLFCFPSINTYCLDVMQGRGSEVIAANYFIRYLFGCLSTATVLPAIEHIGVGWYSTISALFLVVSAAGVACAIHWGQEWRERTDRYRNAKRKAAYEKEHGPQ